LRPIDGGAVWSKRQNVELEVPQLLRAGPAGWFSKGFGWGRQGILDLVTVARIQKEADRSKSIHEAFIGVGRDLERLEQHDALSRAHVHAIVAQHLSCSVCVREKESAFIIIGLWYLLLRELSKSERTSKSESGILMKAISLLYRAYVHEQVRVSMSKMTLKQNQVIHTIDENL